jgi:hypothetical protein
MKKSIKLLTKDQAKPLIKPFLSLVAEQLESGKIGWLQWQENTRSLEQNARLHAMIADIAKQIDYLGKKRTLDEWKTLLISAHSIATKEGAEVIPGIEGEYVSIRESSASMSVARMTSLMDYVEAYGTINGVKFRTLG